MAEHRIEYREKPREEWELWACRIGTLDQACKSAVGLLESLWDENLKNPKVRVNGKMLTPAIVKQYIEAPDTGVQD